VLACCAFPFTDQSVRPEGRQWRRPELSDPWWFLVFFWFRFGFLVFAMGFFVFIQIDGGEKKIKRFVMNLIFGLHSTFPLGYFGRSLTLTSDPELFSLKSRNYSLARQASL